MTAHRRCPWGHPALDLDELSVLLSFSGAGLQGSKPDVISKLEQGEEPWAPHSPRIEGSWIWRRRRAGESAGTPPRSRAPAGRCHHFTGPNCITTRALLSFSTFFLFFAINGPYSVPLNGVMFTLP